MKTLLISSGKQLSIALFYACFGIGLALTVTGIWLLNGRADLSPWHTHFLSHEFDRHKGVEDFGDYLKLEQQLFTELDQELGKLSGGISSPINRYHTGSIADPKRWALPWNQSFEWANADAQFGLLLLHGMSDSPYAMHQFAEQFKGRAHVLALRLPGHGTLPSGLVRLEWQDLAAAVRLASRHMSQVLNGKPLYVIGYSTGASLALNHELENLHSGRPTDYEKVVMLSPAIGLAPMAVGAQWQSQLGYILGLEKLSWNTISPEYDPFKYSSFAVNAGDVVYRLAQHNSQRLLALPEDKKRQLPPILAFQSLVDDSVSTKAVLENLFLQLPKGANELVIYDMNRSQVNLSMTPVDPLAEISGILARTNLTFRGTLIENQVGFSHLVQAREFGTHTGVEKLDFKWPVSVYSLSHVALPFSANDSLYGNQMPNSMERIQIGAAASRGERGVISIPAADMLRQRWNPFFDYQMQRIEAFFSQDPEPTEYR
ncbi:alpha/beta hydrolase [Shewanella algae]|uniref:alpha/beta hydrolase n=1 Tax=Shewanella algae TaxID=38313 RepID=UPI003D7D0305